MFVQTLKPTGVALDRETLGAVMAEPEAPVSDAPIATPPAAGGLLVLLGRD
ncbi:hypothetical protein FHR84_004078 [Actinopolyspora biskrensis]|uniref:Uncharacterized protein n=1 Tax=Actinopolyspora biskrensis TaxID=1470178 RepID=A0A852Z3Y0_9ACTN|nr:hypothetical protein [Actinopolyspora biskrensis]